MAIFTEVVLPVLLIFLAGFGLQKWKRLDIKPFSTVAIYILTPMLVFQNIYLSDLDKQYASMVAVSVILLTVLIFINKIYCYVRKKGRATESGLILATAFMNSGNYGVPIVLFAYGEEAFGYAVSLMVIHIILMNFFGIYYAARGSGGMKTAVKAVFEMPPTYAVLIAVFLKIFNLQVPNNILSVVDLLAPATIPVVMVILGMQLAEINLFKLEWEKVSFAVILRLFISPAITLGILLILPVDELLAKVLILISAMPSAANTVIYAVQYDSEPNLVSSITLLTTLLSIFTITLMLVLLG